MLDQVYPLYSKPYKQYRDDASKPLATLVKCKCWNFTCRLNPFLSNYVFYNSISQNLDYNGYESGYMMKILQADNVSLR